MKTPSRNINCQSSGKALLIACIVFKDQKPKWPLPVSGTFIACLHGASGPRVHTPLRCQSDPLCVHSALPRAVLRIPCQPWLSLLGSNRRSSSFLDPDANARRISRASKLRITWVMVFSSRFLVVFGNPNIPKAFPWLKFLPWVFTPLYGLYHGLYHSTCWAISECSPKTLL